VIKSGSKGDNVLTEEKEKEVVVSGQMINQSDISLFEDADNGKGGKTKGREANDKNIQIKIDS